MPRRVSCGPSSVLRRGMQERWERVEWDTVSSLGHDQPWPRAPCSVRAAPNDFRRGFKKIVYQRWFGPEAWARRESWTFHLPRRVSCGRWGSPVLPFGPGFLVLSWAAAWLVLGCGCIFRTGGTGRIDGWADTRRCALQIKSNHHGSLRHPRARVRATTATTAASQGDGAHAEARGLRPIPTIWGGEGGGLG
jgi:hypothetical protein